MPASPSSPSIDNYYIGKGILKLSKDNGSTWIDLGNCPKFQFTPKATTLDHYSSREGTRVLDDTIITTVEGQMEVTLDEWTPQNLATALLGDPDNHNTIDVFSETSGVEGMVRFVGTNDVGPKIIAEFYRVRFVNDKALDFIGDGYGEIQLNARVLKHANGHFGHVHWTDGSTDVSPGSDSYLTP